MHELRIAPAKTFGIFSTLAAIAGIGFVGYKTGAFDAAINVIDRPINKDKFKGILHRAEKTASDSEFYKTTAKRKLEEAQERLNILYESGRNSVAADQMDLDMMKDDYKTLISIGADDDDFSVFIDKLNEIGKEAKID